MFGKITSLGALLALLVSAGSAAAKPSETASCCAARARCCSPAKACCDQPAKRAATSVCPVTGRTRAQCCASKASPMPPCCQRACDTPTLNRR